MVDAVACTVAVQGGVTVHQPEVPPESRIVFRVGINLGDVVVEGDDLLGDGVNIAARLEAFAEPGGISIADTVRQQLAGKTDFAFEDTGEHTLKNIAQPVRVWRWAREPASAPAGEPLPLPDKPSIAVLPFDNLSGQPEETYFSDGITEDIITGLARFRSLFVIARNSSFAFRGKSIDLAEIGRRLGVAYLLEGSVRRAGDRVRITAQLIEAATGAHVWAERYDRSLDDIFAVQDEVAQMIVSKLFGRMEEAELQQSLRKPIVNLTAYDFLLRGTVHIRGYEPNDNVQALHLFERAVEIDPSYGRAHSCCGLATAFVHRDTTAAAVPREALDAALRMALTGARLNPQDSRSHTALTVIHLMRREHELAEHHARHAVDLNPNDADAMATVGDVLARRGHPEEGLEWINKAKRLNPYHPPFYDSALAVTLYAMRRYREAVQVYNRLPGLHPWLRAGLAASLAQLGQTTDANEHVRLLLRAQPGLGGSVLCRQRMPV